MSKPCNKDCLNCTFTKCKFDIEDRAKAIKAHERAHKREISRRWDAAHREYNRQRSKAWYEAHREEHIAKVCARYWEKKNGEQAKQCS